MWWPVCSLPGLEWVLIGIGVGALLHGFVPAAVLLGVPLYSNATGIIPVTEAMLTKGVAVETTLALSVAALSLPNDRVVHAGGIPGPDRVRTWVSG